MTDRLQAARSVLLYCVGDESYRQRHQSDVATSVSASSAHGLTRLLGQAHLMGMLFKSFGELPPSRSLEALNDSMQAQLAARAIFNGHLARELDHIGERLLSRFQVTRRPLVMKGISYWGTYYGDPLERRVRDLDVLVEGEDDIDALCDTLEGEGYEGLHFVGDERSVRAHLKQGEYYSAPPYRLRRRIILDGDLPADVAGVIRHEGEGIGLEYISPTELVITIDFELHTALFVTERGERPQCLSGYRQPSSTLPGFDQLTPGATLAYAASKFALDCLETLSSGEASLKPLKLAADVVRIIGRCTQHDYDEAFRVALQWRCLHHLIDVVQSLAPLLPDVSLSNLPKSPGESYLALLLEQALERNDDHRLCLA